MTPDGSRPPLPRIARLPSIAPEGRWLVIAIGAATLGAFLLEWRWLALAFLVAVVAALLFFRDPERLPESGEGLVVSGADGRVSDLAQAQLNGGLGAPFQRVSVFMSPLDVHVNRAPVSGKVLSVTHIPGVFRAAFRDSASQLNERNLVVIADHAGRRHALAQVAGYFCRRIVCRLRPGDEVECGQRIGLIMFGSRVDHFVPPGYRVTVKPGQRVRAGETIIGEPVVG